MAALKILIAGSSIAGPATAYWLARAGFHVTLIERFPSLRPGGQAVDIRTFGVSIMRKIPGLESAVRGASTQEEGVALVDERGHPYGVIRATGSAERQGVVSEFEILRGELSRVLVDLTAGNDTVKYIFDESIASMDREIKGDLVRVQFSNRTPDMCFDLVVAADGASSRTRSMAFGSSGREHMHATNSWAAYFSVKNDYLASSKIGHGHSAPGGRFVSIGHDAATGGNKVMFMCVNQSASSMESFRQAAANGEDALRQFVASRFEGVGWLTNKVLADMQHTSDFYASEISQVKLPSLYQNRTVCVGDAGYAAGPTGGGTSLALAGGYFLAGELLAHPNDIEAALKAYEERMRPLIEEMQKIPPFVGTIMAPQTSWGIVVRNWVFAGVAWSGVAEWAQRYLAPAFQDGREVRVEEYEWVR